MRLTRQWLRTVPLSMFARVTLILLLGLGAVQVASLWLQSGERATAVFQARGQNFADRIAEAVRVLEASEPVERKATLAALQSSNLRAALIADDQVSPTVPHGQIQALVASRLGADREIRAMGGGRMQRDNPMRSFDVRLRDGQWIRVTALLDTSTPALSNELLIRLLVAFAVVIACVLLAVRQVNQPLEQLARAADTLGRDLDAPPLAETGPTETRRAAQAFNRMQARIRHLVAERARALAAVSHDLRTPLTRLRLRTELVEDDELRRQIATDLDAMASMIDATLDYLRGLHETEAPRRIDMNALLLSMSADADLLGKQVSVSGTALAPYFGRLSALRRALQNLIDNAIKYGYRARVHIDDSDSELRIVIEDDGPGIAPEDLTRVTEPYYRPDASRGQETGGVGLGLSIASDIALMHGGELVLENTTGSGLSATLVLPRKSVA